jgi:hypothetical protein
MHLIIQVLTMPLLPHVSVASPYGLRPASSKSESELDG